MKYFHYTLSLNLIVATAMAARRLNFDTGNDYADGITKKFIDPGVAYNKAGNVSFDDDSRVLMVYDHYVDTHLSYLSINYALYNQILAEGIRKRQWLEEVGTQRRQSSKEVDGLIIIITDTFKSAPSAKDIIHPIIVNTDWIDFVATIASIAVSVSNTSTTDAYPCYTACYTRFSSDYGYNFCLDTYTKKGKTCSFSSSAENDVKQALQDAIAINARSDCVARCMLLYNNGVTEIWLKYVRHDGGVASDEVSCKTGSERRAHDEL